MFSLSPHELTFIKVLRKYCLVAFNMRNEHVLPILGIVDDAAFGGFCMILPWMENGNIMEFLTNKNPSSKGRISLVSTDSGPQTLGFDHLRDFGRGPGTEVLARK